MTPYNIRQAILGLPMRRTYRCRKHGTVTQELTFNPFSVEIEGKRHIMMACPECDHDLELESDREAGR